MIALIVAHSKNRVIGNNGVIPWKIPGEQKRFKELTTGNIVIMGRKTFEEIGHALPNRTTVIISSNPDCIYEDCITETSLDAAIRLSELHNKDVFISGGAGLYKEAIETVDKMYITVIDEEYEGDRFFPEVDPLQFILEEEIWGDETKRYKYLTYRRKKVGE